jgi:hypothetical protein
MPVNEDGETLPQNDYIVKKVAEVETGVVAVSR